MTFVCFFLRKGFFDRFHSLGVLKGGTFGGFGSWGLIGLSPVFFEDLLARDSIFRGVVRV